MKEVGPNNMHFLTFFFICTIKKLVKIKVFAHNCLIFQISLKKRNFNQFQQLLLNTFPPDEFHFLFLVLVSVLQIQRCLFGTRNIFRFGSNFWWGPFVYLLFYLERTPRASTLGSSTRSSTASFSQLSLSPKMLPGITKLITENASR